MPAKNPADGRTTSLYRTGASILARLNREKEVAQQQLDYHTHALEVLGDAKQDTSAALQGLVKAHERAKSLRSSVENVQRIQKQLTGINPRTGLPLAR